MKAHFGENSSERVCWVTFLSIVFCLFLTNAPQILKRNDPLIHHVSSPIRNRAKLFVHVCMPTVSRPQGADYLWEAVRSFHNQTSNLDWIGTLTVYNMQKGCRAQGKHISDTLVAHPSPQRMFDAFVRRDGFAETSSWLSIRFREGDALPPRKQTHGDTITRVKWRSKEALDYVQTLQRCAQEHPDIPYYAVIQDDVVFTDRIRDLRDWVENKKRTQVCTLSLFDFDQKQDNGILIRANMVARLWKKRMIDPFTQYVIRRYDDSPIDWLHDDFCRPLNLRTMVMVPNPVRHLGEISTLINKLSPTN